MAKGDLIPEFKAEWLKALRSRRYKQGQQALYGRDTGTYCCLGVAADLLCMLDVESGAEVIAGSPGLLAGDVLEAIGLDHDAMVTLIDKNDDGKSFAQIADYIEENL